MSDLVERLRGPGREYFAGTLLSEAAAEIERLTAALASEREACALTAESIAVYGRQEIASAIRARGKEI